LLILESTFGDFRPELKIKLLVQLLESIVTNVKETVKVRDKSNLSKQYIERGKTVETFA